MPGDEDVGGVVIAPSQLNPAASKRTDQAPASAAGTMLWLNRPMVGAVLRRDLEEIGGGLHARRARHIGRHNRRIARNVPAEMAGQQAAIEVIGAAGVRTDDEA